MIDATNSWSAVQAATVQDPSAAAAPPPVWKQNAAPDASWQTPPSIGTGQDLPWARTWAELSGRLRGTGVEVEAIAQRMAGPQGPEDIKASLADMLRASKRMSETAIEFQMTSGVVTNAATSVNKLLTQQ